MKKIITLLLFFTLAINSFWSQTITVTSPNGGETLAACQISNITWTASGASGFYDVAYSIDNGLNWSSIATNLSALSFSWSVVNIQSNQVKIRVRDANNNATLDLSDNFFTITAALILNTPNGGEVWQANTTQNITWTSNITPTTTQLTIQYSTDAGSTWTNITTTAQAGAQTFAWLIPGTIAPSNFCQIRIFETAVGSVSCRSDISNSVFSITAATPILTVTAPNTAVTLAACQTSNITWTYQFPPTNSAVKLEYTTDNGITWNQITASTTASPFVWTIPQTPSSTCKVKVTSLDNPSIFDVSNVNFTIVNPTITLTSPNTAVTYYQHQTPNPNITWTSTNLSAAATVNIELSLDGGLTWTSLVANTPNDGTQAWPIGAQTPSTQARIRVSTTCNSAFSDISDVNFTIVVPIITVTSPNTNVSYCVGSSTNITWTAPNLPVGNNVKIEYSTDNGSTWIQFLAATPNDLTEAWTIPNTPSGQCLVRISDPLYPANSDISNVVFTIPPVLTNITSPNGGETLIGCTTQNITFAKCGTTGNTKLEYSLDNGVTWTQIATNITTLTYAWTVPNVLSTQCLIRATDLTLGVTDVSNAVFTINPSIQLTSPNGGEIYQVGGPNQTISWVKNGTFTTTLRIDYSTNNGVTWTNIVTGLANTTTSYNWTIPNTPSTTCLVRVYEGTTATPPACKVDQSNATFTISAATPVITVTSPNTNVTWYTGSTTNNITWTYPYYPSNNVKIEYSTDNGVTWTTIIASTPNDNTHLWFPIPNTPSPLCFVRISDAINPLISDVSNVNFTIANPTLTLTSPNGGNDLIGCNTFPITWTAPNLPVGNNVKIEYSTDNGLTWNIVVASTANTGTYTWTIPNTVNSSNCLIRISDAAVSYVTDQSNAPFSITNNSQITLYAPNGGEVWTVGSSQTISWLASGVTGNLTIQYSTNNGTTWTTVSAAVPNTGSYTWTVPNALSAQCLVKIYETATPCKVDQSNAVFTIAAQVPVITVTSPNTAVSWIVNSTNAITWSITNGTLLNVKLEYSTNNGSTWTTIIASTPAASGTYNWNVANAPSTFCLVRVSDALNAAVNDVSNVNFTIYNASTVQAITVTSPNGGDILDGCSGTIIDWNANNCTTVGRLISATGNITNITGTGPWTVTVTVASTTGLHNGATIFATPGVGNIGVGGTYVLNAAPAATSFTYVATGGAPPIAGSLTNISTTTISQTGTVGSITGTGIGPWNATITGMQNTVGLTAGTTFTATNGAMGNLGGAGVFTVTSVTPTSITYSAVGGTTPIIGAITNIKATNTSYKLDYSADNGTTWSPIVALTAQPSNGPCSYLWNPVVGSVNSSNCLIKVANATNLISQVDQSNNLLTIRQPIVLIEPNFGGAYVTGSTMNISWLANGVSGFYNISYSTDGGTTWNVITFNQSIPSNTYQWIVPSTATGQLKIRVSETGNSCKSDDSDVNASILLTPQVVTVNAPNGSETWSTCSSQNITWSSTNASGTYNLQYSTNGGTTWNSIATNVAAGTSGSYAWTVPNNVSGTCLVRVTDAFNVANVDQSNAAFSITQSVPLTVTANSAICSGQSISLTANGAASYSWTPATGLSSATIANPTAVPSATTTYTVTGTLNGCTNSKLVTITVNPIPVVSINQNNVSLCSGVTLQANGANSYTWSPSNGLSNAAIANPIATPTASTLYTVTGTLNGCIAAASVTVNPTPTIAANASLSTICAGTTTNLTATGATAYTWSPTVGLNSGTIANPSASPATTQTYTVTGISNGCSSTANVTVTVNAAPVLTVGSGGSICAGSSYNLTASGATTYSWTPVSGLSNASISNPIAAPSATTTYTVTGSNGTCTAVKTVTVAVIPIPIISITGNQTICSGSSSILTATGGVSYVWSPSSGLNNPWLANPTASPTSTTNYLVTSTVNGCQGTANYTLNVTTSPTIVPTFSAVSAICSGATLPALPTTSTNNIVGSWSPALSNTATNTYTFTPTAGQCAINGTMTITVNSNPTSNIAAGGATTFCEGGSVTLNANTGSGLSYQWIKDGNTIASAIGASYNATNTGNYTVQVTNSNGCSATSSIQNVTVNSNPIVSTSASGSTTFCQGNSVFFTANSGTGLTYQWLNNGSNIPGANTADFTATSAGSYAVIVQNSNGCSASSTANSVTVNPLPTATTSPTGTTTFCQGNSVTINTNTGSGLSYQWQNNGVSISGANSSSYLANSTGSYAVVITDNNGCSQSSSSTAVTVNQLPDNTITLSGSPTFCAGDSAILNAPIGTGLTYQWQNNGTDISGATSPSYVSTTNGSFSVIILDNNGCSATSSSTLITVNPLPISSVTAGGSTTFCQGDSINLIANTGAGLSYQWQNSGINIAGATSSSYNANASGNYSVIVTNSTNCSASSNNTSITVNPLPNVTLNAFNQVCDTFGLVTLFGGNPVGGNYSGSSVNSNSFNTNIGVGVYPITYTYTDVNGCSSSSTESITVIQCGGLSLSEIMDSYFNIYPNPTLNSFNVDFTSNLLDKEYTLLDISGREILKGNLYSIPLTINIEFLQNGTYYFKIKNSSLSIKLIKQ